ncbi:MAG: hypothetical protein U5K31_00495 [Balneolaceae bacterium]|nr:hypothetical protein [Balneolaceae bacterium]
MRAFFGYLLSLGGLACLVYTGINYINNSESFGFLGADVVISSGDPVPVIASAVVMIVGFFLLKASSDA